MKLRVFLNLKHATEELNSVKMGKDLCVARTTRQAIRGGYVHDEQEIFVAAFFRNDETDYWAPPVLLMPTCERGSFRDAALIMEMPHQARKIWPYLLDNSDRDPKRHPTLYLHCMNLEITPADPLHQYVGSLRGMNLYTG